MLFKEDTEESCEIQMGPLMDSVFLLLLYFLSACQKRIVDVLNACAAVGVKNLSFSAN